MVRLLALPMMFAAVGARGGFLDHQHSAQTHSAASSGVLSEASGAGYGGDRAGGAPVRKSYHEPNTYHRSVHQGAQESSSFQITFGVDKTITSEFIKNLWAGQDYPLGFFSVKGPTSEPQGNVQIFGLPNSGTTLLRALLYANWGSKLNYFDEGKTFGRGRPDDGHANYNILYRSTPEHIRRFINPEVYAIFVVRNPYGWLHSLRSNVKKGNAYMKPAMQDCVKDPDWLFKPCAFEMLDEYEVLKNDETKVRRVEFESLPQIWNKWAKGYLHASAFGITRRFVVAYENLVRAPEAVLDNLATFLRVTPPQKYAIPFNMEERKGEVDRISQNVTYGFTSEENYQVCKRLNPQLLEMVGFETFTCEDFASFMRRDPTSGRDPTTISFGEPNIGAEYRVEPEPTFDADFFTTANEATESDGAPFANERDADFFVPANGLQMDR